MKSKQRFPESIISAVHQSKILGIRAGSKSHRFTGIWVVTVRSRIFVRSWDNRKDGWHQTFLKEPQGAIHIDGEEYAVRARKTKSEGLLDAIDRAYAEKYHTPASRKYVRGFALPHRRKTTIELVPLSFPEKQAKKLR